MKKRILSLFVVICMLCACVPCVVSAYDGTQYGDLYYEINGDGTVKITDCKNVASVDIPARIDGMSVASIGDYAFAYCDSLTSITISYSVTNIGDSAFQDCTNLTSITIPDSVTSIGEYAFQNCTNLTNITIPDSVTSIGDSAFYNTAYYNNASNWENSLLYIGNHIIKAKSDAIVGSYVIKNNTKVIAGYAFYKCDSLTSITIPNSVTSIGEGAFWGCGITSITIPNSVTSIGDGAFENCDRLTSITTPDSVISIGDYAFGSCNNLTSINVDSNNKNYCSADGNLFDKNKTVLIQYSIGKEDASYLIPDSVTSIGDYAFGNCSRLTSITIPDSVTSIGAYAFSGCPNLTSITIPDSVTAIGNYAFRNCDSLTSITIPNSVTSISRC